MPRKCTCAYYWADDVVTLRKLDFSKDGTFSPVHSTVGATLKYTCAFMKVNRKSKEAMEFADFMQVYNNYYVTFDFLWE